MICLPVASVSWLPKYFMRLCDIILNTFPNAPHDLVSIHELTFVGLGLRMVESNAFCYTLVIGGYSSSVRKQLVVS